MHRINTDICSLSDIEKSRLSTVNNGPLFGAGLTIIQSEADAVCVTLTENSKPKQPFINHLRDAISMASAILQENDSF